MALENKDFESSLRRPAIEEQGGEKVLIPPLGQLTVEQIAASDEAAVDKMLSERHSLYPQYVINAQDTGESKILPLKRLALGRLEGIHIGVLAEHAKELGSQLRTPESVKVVLSTSLEPSVVQRISENIMRIRMTAIQTDPELISLTNQILKKTKLELGELFNNLPQYNKEGIRGSATSWVSLRVLLNAYNLACDGMNWSKIMKNINDEENARNPTRMPFDDSQTLRQAVSKNFSDKALEKIRGR